MMALLVLIGAFIVTALVASWVVHIKATKNRLEEHGRRLRELETQQAELMLGSDDIDLTRLIEQLEQQARAGGPRTPPLG